MKYIILTGTDSYRFLDPLAVPQLKLIIPTIAAKLTQAQASGDLVFVLYDLPPQRADTGTGETCHDFHPDPRIRDLLLRFEKDKLSFIGKSTHGASHLPPAIWRQAQIWGLPDEMEFIGSYTGLDILANALLVKSEFYQRKITVDAACCACKTLQSHQTALDALHFYGIKIKNEGDRLCKNS